MVGTVNYIDPRCHPCNEGWNECQGTDIISLVYTIIALRSEFKWSNKYIKRVNYNSTKQWFDAIGEAKKQANACHLCKPAQIARLALVYIKMMKLKYGESPEYDVLIKHFDDDSIVRLQIKTCFEDESLHCTKTVCLFQHMMYFVFCIWYVGFVRTVFSQKKLDHVENVKNNYRNKSKINNKMGNCSMNVPMTKDTKSKIPVNKYTSRETLSKPDTRDT